MRKKVQRLAAFCGIDDAIVLADVANRRRNRFAATPGNTPPAEFVRTTQQDNNVDQSFANGQCLRVWQSEFERHLDGHLQTNDRHFIAHTGRNRHAAAALTESYNNSRLGNP